MAALFRSAQQLGGKMQELQNRLRAERVTGSAGGGLVEVEANGLGELLRVRIDSQLVAKGEQDMIETLTPVAVNQALEKARQLHAETIQSLGRGLDLPGLSSMLGQLMGNSSVDPEAPGPKG